MTWQEQRLWATARKILTQTQYETLWMRYQCDIPIEDIARSYGVSRQAIHGRLAAAKRRLATHPDFAERTAA